MSPIFQDLPKAIRNDTAAWQQLFDASEPQNVAIPGKFSELSAFDKLLVIRMIRPDKLIPAVRIPCSLVLGLAHMYPVEHLSTGALHLFYQVVLSHRRRMLPLF
jgi:dynein heavy chain, axonemal